MNKAIVGIFAMALVLLLLNGCIKDNGGQDNTPNPVWIDQNFLTQFKDNPIKVFDGNSITLNLDSNSIQLNFDINLGVADKNFVADLCSISCQYIYADPSRILDALPGVDVNDKTFPKSTYQLLQNKNNSQYSCVCTWRICSTEQDPEFPGQTFCTDNSKKYAVEPIN